MKRTDIFNQMIATMLVCTLLSSCLKEDWSNCPEQIRVYFDISPRNGGDAINPANIDQMHLYVFNQQGYFLNEYHDGLIIGFSDDYYMDCSDLTLGNYRFIAWSGKDEHCYSIAPISFQKGETTFQEALLILERTGNIAASVSHHIFHGDLSASVIRARIQRFDVPMTQLTNTIRIRTTGLPTDMNDYTFNIADNNYTYRFDSSFANDPAEIPFTYTVPCTRNVTDQLNSSLNVMKLSADRHTPQLQIFNATADTPLYPTGTQSGDLIEMIQNAYPQNDFDAKHTYDIELRFVGDDATGFTVTVIINGWELRHQDDELY